MTQRDWGRGEAKTVGVFLNGDEIPTHSPRGEDAARRLVHAPLQRPLRADHVPPARPAASGCAGRSCSRPPTAASATAATVVAAREPIDVDVAVDRDPAPRRVGASVPAFRATYRLQLGPHLDFARRARARAVPGRARRLAPVPVADHAGAAAARRTATTSSTRPRSRTRSAARTGSARCARPRVRPGSAIVLDVVPNHMAASEEENPFWRDPLLRAKFFDLDWRTGGQPPLLRHRRARRRADGGSRGLRGAVAEGARVRRRGPRRRAADRPPGRARLPGALPAAAARGRRRARLGREDPRARRAAPRLAGRGHDGLRVPQRLDGAASSTRTRRSRSPSCTGS